MFITTNLELSFEDFKSLKTQLLLLSALSEQTRLPIERFLQEDDFYNWNIPRNCLPPLRKCLSTVKSLFPLTNATQLAALTQDEHPYIAHAAKKCFIFLKRY